jgi:hypothetical protein
MTLIEGVGLFVMNMHRYGNILDTGVRKEVKRVLMDVVILTRRERNCNIQDKRRC